MSTYVITENGALPERAVRLNEIIQDFDDTLELRWIPPDKRGAFDSKPFAVWQTHPNYEPYLVMALREDELDHRVLAALFRAQNITMDQIEAEEAARDVIAMKKRMDEQDAETEFVHWALKSPRTVKHNGVKYE